MNLFIEHQHGHRCILHVHIYLIWAHVCVCVTPMFDVLKIILYWNLLGYSSDRKLNSKRNKIRKQNGILSLWNDVMQCNMQPIAFSLENVINYFIDMLAICGDGMKYVWCRRCFSISVTQLTIETMHTLFAHRILST